jgi:pimeloyl-ACP methyl ester carboxylesterase
MPVFDFGGQRVFFTFHREATSAGDSRPSLVLIHGVGGSHLHWPPLLRRLDGVDVYAFDLPGHGRSAGRSFTSVEQYTALIAAWAESLGLSNFVLAGHSLGSAIALDVSLTHPRLLAGLVLVGASSRLPVSPAILDGLTDDFVAATELITRLSYAENTPEIVLKKHTEHLRKVDPQTLIDGFTACNAFDVTGRVARVAALTLIIGGQQDRMTPPKQSQRLHQAISGSALHLLDCGHMIPIERPQETTRLIATFIEDV